MAQPLERDGSSGPPDIRLEGLRKDFGETVAVDEIDLAVAPGSYATIVGPAGCGKTTLLRLIGGFETPSRGRIFIGGQDVTALAPDHREVNTVFSTCVLFPHLTVEQNIAFGLKHGHLARDEIRERVAETVALLDLTHIVDRKPAQLLGVQKQRVALGRALVNRPRVLLLDEPLSSFDASLRRQLQAELKLIQSMTEVTFIHATGDQEEALATADELIVMNRGRIEQNGTPVGVHTNPQTQFVATFLNCSNLIPGRVSETQEQLTVVRTANDRALFVPADRGGRSLAGRQVRLGIGSERLTLHNIEPKPFAGNYLPGKVMAAVSVGSARRYSVRTEEGDILTVSARSAAIGGTRFGPGSEVAVAWKPEHTFLVKDEPK